MRALLPNFWGTLRPFLPEIRRGGGNRRGLDPVLVIVRGFRVRSFLQRPSGTGRQRFVRSAGPSGRLERLGWMVTRPGGARVRDEEAGEGGERGPGRLVAQRLGQGRPQWVQRGCLLMMMVVVMMMVIGGGDRVRRRVVHAATAEHERVHAHAHVRALRLDALPHEHAGALLGLWTRGSTGFRGDFVTVTSIQRAQGPGDARPPENCGHVTDPPHPDPRFAKQLSLSLSLSHVPRSRTFTLSSFLAVHSSGSETGGQKPLLAPAREHWSSSPRDHDHMCH